MKSSKLLLILFCLLVPFESSAEIVKRCETPTGEGFLERTAKGDLILHLQGSYYDMGYQHGCLLKEESLITLRAIDQKLKKDLPLVPIPAARWWLRSFIFNQHRPHIPAKYLDEMRGLADATGVPTKTIEAYHGLTYATNCGVAAVWGPATADGRLYLLRSNDNFVDGVDPVTGTAIRDQTLIVVYRPENEFAYMMTTLPGYIGAAEGMNEKGIALAPLANQSRHETPDGLPMIFRLREVLSRADSLDAAIGLISERPLAGAWIFVLADAKIPEGVAVEMDAEKVYVGEWDGPAESSEYVYQGRSYRHTPAEGMVVRTNHPLSLDLIADFNGTIDRDETCDSTSGKRYNDLRQRLLAEYGTLDLDSLNRIMRSHYHDMYQGKGDRCFMTSTHQLVMSPSTGEFIVAFAHGDPARLGPFKVSAYNQPLSRYNFFELLGRVPR